MKHFPVFIATTLLLVAPATATPDPFMVPPEIRDMPWKSVHGDLLDAQGLDALDYRIGSWISEGWREDRFGRHRIRVRYDREMDGHLLRSRSYRVFEDGTERLYLEVKMFEHPDEPAITAHLYFDDTFDGLFADAIWAVDPEGYQRLDCDLFWPDGRRGQIRDFFLPVGRDTIIWSTYSIHEGRVSDPEPANRITLRRETGATGHARSEGRLPLTASPEAIRHYERGYDYLDALQLPQAKAEFEAALEIDPDFLLAKTGLAWSQDRFRELFELLQEARDAADDADISEAERLSVIAQHASANSAPDVWLDATRRLAEMFPDDARAQYDHATALRGSSRDADAVAFYDRALAIDPGFGRAHGARARTLTLLGDVEAAERGHRRYVELEPEAPRAWLELGNFLLQQGEVSRGLDAYQGALTIEPLFEFAHMGVVTAMMLLERHDDARHHLEELYDRVAHDGIRSGIHFALSVVEADRGDLDTAVRELEANYALSAKIGDTFAMAQDLNNRGRVLLEAGRWDEAEEAFRAGRDVILESDHPESRKRTSRNAFLELKGRVEVGRGDLAEAEALALEYLENVEPLGVGWQIRRGHDLLGRIAEVRGDWDAALAHYEKGTKDDADVMYRIAGVWGAKGRPDKEQEWLGYVVEYRGVLNLAYALVRRDAEARYAELSG